MELKSLDKLYNNIKEHPEYKKLDSKQMQMISIIMRYYKSELKAEKENLFFRNKIQLNFVTLVYLSKQAIFRTDSILAHDVTKWLKMNRFISSKSKLYPVNSKYISSTLPLSFLQIDFPIMDKILNLRDNLFNEYQNNRDIGLYIYLRLFQVKKIDKEDIVKMNIKKNIYKLSDKIYVFIETQDIHAQGYVPIIKYLFDYHIINFINNFNIETFPETINTYEKEVRKYTKKHNLHYQDVQRSIQFEYAYNNCQFDLTLKLQTNYPKLNLSEINYLFPNCIPSELLKIEKTNEQLYFKIFKDYTIDLDYDDEILDSNHKATKYISYSIESYDLLKKCINVPLEDDKFDSYLNKYYKQIIQFKEHDNTSYLFKIFDFVEFLIKKADEKHTKNPIKKSTLKEYLRIMFSYCFHYIVIEGALTNEVYNEIREKINIFADESLYIQNSNITTRTTNVYYRLIKLFWKRYTNFKTEASLKMIVDIRRSIVFEDEIDSFIEILKTKEFTAPTKDIKFKKTIKPVFCLLLFYSGLRKTELRTLLTKNIELVNNEEFEIIVSKENFKLTSKANNELELHEKSDSAIRKVRFSIKNQKHLKLIKQYVHFLEKNQIKFTFPAISNKENIKKTKPIKNDFINELPRKLSEHTGRYTPLHSLRHSYATFKTLSLFTEAEHFLVYELCKLIGHSEPTVTLENYIHIDLLFILKEITCVGRIPNLSSSYQFDVIECKS